MLPTFIFPTTTLGFDAGEKGDFLNYEIHSKLVKGDAGSGKD